MLDTLKRLGESSVDEIADVLGISVAGARQHLAALVGEELVVARDEPRAGGERGRPRRIYALSPRSEPLFPKAYDALTNELLRYADAEDRALVERIFSRRRDSRIENARSRLSSKPTLRDRVAELARILDEDGYLADWEELSRDAFRIVEHNCAILAVAERHPHACRSEIEFIQAVLPETRVERVSHIVSGAHQCAYMVRRRAPNAPGSAKLAS